MPLPLYTMGQNQFDTSPLENALWKYAQHQEQQRQNAFRQQQIDMDRTRLGFEGERLGFERDRQPGLLDHQRLVNENLPRQGQLIDAQAYQARKHGDYYDAAGTAALNKADNGRERAHAYKQKVYGELLQRIGTNITPDLWERENQPGGIIHTAFGGPMPWEQRGAVLAQARQRLNATPDEMELMDSGFDENTIRRMRRSKQMEGIYGRPKPGFIWDYDERMQPFQKPVAEADTVGERNSQIIAKTGIKNLDDAERILNKSNWIWQTLGDRWTIPGTASAKNPEGWQVGGFGEAGRGFKAAEMALLELNFALSGKSVSNAERDAFKRLYMPSSQDSVETQQFKLKKVRDYFNTVLEARRRGATEEQVGEMYRGFIREGSQPQQPRPTGPTAPALDMKKRYGLE